MQGESGGTQPKNGCTGGGLTFTAQGLDKINACELMNTVPCKERGFFELIITEKGKDKKGENMEGGTKEEILGQ